MPRAVSLQVGPALARFTGTAEGDLGPASRDPEVEGRRRAIVNRPWATVHQVHGGTVVQAGSGYPDADAVVTDRHDCAVAVFTADCVPVLFASPDGVIAAVHAGWRGLVAGIIESSVAAMSAMGASDITAAVGPCIHACCYEFSDSDLDDVQRRYGPAVASTTRDGRLALDLPVTVGRALEGAGVRISSVSEACTACTPGYFSHRARQDKQRQAGLIWLP